MSEPISNMWRRLTIAALAVAVIALALSGWAVFQVWSDGSRDSSHSAEQRASAKQKVCTATDLVREGITLNTNLQPAGGPRDVTGTLAVAANARVSLYDGGQYLLAQLDAATPPELADAIRKLGNTLTDIGAAATAGAQNSEPEQAARLREADSIHSTITELCN